MTITMPPESVLALWGKKVDLTEVLTSWVNLLPADVAVFAVDQDRNVILWNKAAERYLEIQAADILGQNCRKANRCQECLVSCPIAEYGRVFQQPLTFYLDQGRTVTMRKTATAFFDQDGRFAGGIEVLTPVVEEPSNVEEGTPEEEEEQEGPYVTLTESAETEFLGEMVTRDQKMKRVFHLIRNIAETEATVLIQGESGTGKELTARAIHQESNRRHGPFVAVNCGALTPSLLESELFGHSKGAFTGAVTKRIGLFQRANGGTIFLDEIAEMPMHLQSKLLRVIEEREVLPLGDSAPVKVDIRVISATHKSLPKEAREGRFREDLMYRLRVVPIHLPPLRDRRRDLSLLVWHLIERYNTFGPRHIKHIDPEAVRLIRRYPWPGNVRELRNAIEYAFAVGRDDTLHAEELPYDIIEYEPPTQESSSQGELPASVLSQRSWRGSSQYQPSAHSDSSDDDEKERIAQALKEADGHVGRAAAMLGISRPTLWRKRKKYNL